MTNQNLAVREYQSQYKQMLGTVFNVSNAFTGLLAPIQILNGVESNAKAFSVKTSATPVVIGEYSTDANTAFGTGTAKSSRFGEMKEVIYEDTQVDYDYTLTIHEGIDRFTVNNNLDAAIADRMKLQSEAQTRQMNKRIGKFVSDNAGHTEALADLTESSLRALFNKVSSYVVNNEINVAITAYVKSDVYNAIIDMTANTHAKGSSVSIDNNGLAKYKNIKLVVTPDQYFADGVVAIFAPDNIVIPFVGIQTTRTVEAINFDGVIFQAAAKGGTYVLDDNKKAIIKVTGNIA